MNTQIQSEKKARAHKPIVADLMSTDLFTVFEDDTIYALDELMKWRRIRHVPVVDAGGRLKGLITQRDFLAIAISRLSRISPSELQSVYREIGVREIMNRKVVTVSPQTPLAEAAKILFGNKFGCLPVVEENQLVGIITEADFVKAFMSWEATFQDV